MKPYPYQLECLDVLSRVRGKGTKKALAVLATGLGKTVVAAFDVKAYLKENPKARILYLAHQNDILTQARETFEEVLEDECTFGFFTGVEKTPHEVTCLFASFQTMKNCREGFLREEFDYIVVDESHHGQAASYRLTLRYFKPSFLLAITATPDRKDLKDIRHLYGAEVFRITLEEALALNYLSPVEYWLLIDEIQATEIVESSEGRHSISELNRRLFIPRRDEEIARVIAEKTSDIKDPKIVVFCSSIKHCDNLAALMPNAAAIHSKLPSGEQKERLKAFKSGSLSTIITVDKFNEGVDLPAANVIVFLRATSSMTIFTQQLGRGLRKSEGKTSVLVLDFVGNCERLEKIRDLDERVTNIRKAHMSEGEEKGDRSRGVLMVSHAGEFHFTELVQNVLSIIGDARRVHTRETIIAQLQTLSLELGHTLTFDECVAASKRNKCASPSKISLEFGNYNSALKAAGLQVNHNIGYTRESVVAQLKALAKKLGKSPAKSDILEANGRGEVASYPTIMGMFGSFNSALEAASLGLNRKFRSDQEILRELTELVASLGRMPTSGDISKASREGKSASQTTIIARFGSLKQALVVAGVYVETVKPSRRKPEPRKVYTKEGIIEELKELARELGHTPSLRELKEASKAGKSPSGSTVVGHFGSLNKAMEAAGLPVSRMGTGQTEAEMLSSLRSLGNELGRAPTTKDVTESTKCPSVSLYATRFGTFNNAVIAAGFEPIRVVRNVKRK